MLGTIYNVSTPFGTAISNQPGPTPGPETF